MKINNEYVSYFRKSKEFEIETDSGEILDLCKTIIDSDSETDSDYEFTEESKKKFDTLSEEDQDEILDFINELEME